HVGQLIYSYRSESAPMNFLFGLQNPISRRELAAGCWSALVAALLLPALLGTEFANVAWAAITTSGNFNGTGTPYNGTDNPWATSNLIVGNTAPGSMSIDDGFVVNNTGIGVIAYSSVASTSTVSVGGGTGASTWTNSGSLAVGYDGIGKLDITGGGSVSN